MTSDGAAEGGASSDASKASTPSAPPPAGAAHQRCATCAALQAELTAVRAELDRAALLLLGERRRAEEAEARFRGLARALGAAAAGGSAPAAPPQQVAPGAYATGPAAGGPSPWGGAPGIAALAGGSMGEQQQARLSAELAVRGAEQDPSGDGRGSTAESKNADDDRGNRTTEGQKRRKKKVDAEGNSLPGQAQQLAGQKRKVGGSGGTAVGMSPANAMLSVNSAALRAVQPGPVAAMATASAASGGHTPPSAASGVAHSASRRGDPRMNRAVSAKLSQPSISLLDALVLGGFVFPTHLHHPGDGGNDDLQRNVGTNDKSIVDSEGVSLYQRKNQLNRRLRKAKG